ncbi:hypothetical protein P8452_12700 [Trifolium repens]|nr:hypothetical protein P8452_12700 [Trifolium repens]
MAPQANLSIAKIGYEIEKFFGRQKSFGNNSNPPATQNLCQYKCYPTYGATTITKVVHTNIVEDLTCNEAASRFIEEKRIDQLHVKGLIGQRCYTLRNPNFTKDFSRLTNDVEILCSGWWYF